MFKLFKAIEMTDEEYLKDLVKALYIMAEKPDTVFSKPIIVYLEQLKKKRGQLNDFEKRERASNIEGFFTQYFQEDLNKFGVIGEINKKNKGFIDFLEHIISKADLH